MKELSLFIDESGDFGEYDYHSPYYIITMVMHDQSVDINKDIKILERKMQDMGMGNHCLHAGPIIRAENEYKNYTVKERQKLLMTMMTFIRHLDIRFRSIYIEKKNISDTIDATGKLSRQLAIFIREYYSFFNSFDIVKIYYDNGQIEINKILSSVFNTLLDNVEFRKVIPADYRLFQVADLICTLQLLELKLQKKELSKSEMIIFNDERTIRKNYLKPIERKRL